MKILQDDDPMPFGKHKGEPMEDVPVGYLHWLWHNGMKSKTKESDVAEYIQRNMSALKMENKDLVWD